MLLQTTSVARVIDFSSFFCWYLLILVLAHYLAVLNISPSHSFLWDNLLTNIYLQDGMWKMGFYRWCQSINYSIHRLHSIAITIHFTSCLCFNICFVFFYYFCFFLGFNLFLSCIYFLVFYILDVLEVMGATSRVCGLEYR